MARENSKKGFGVNFGFSGNNDSDIIPKTSRYHSEDIPISSRRKRIGQNVGFEGEGYLKLVTCFCAIYRILVLVMHALKGHAGVHSWS